MPARFLGPEAIKNVRYARTTQDLFSSLNIRGSFRRAAKKAIIKIRVHSQITVASNRQFGYRIFNHNEPTPNSLPVCYDEFLVFPAVNHIKPIPFRSLSLSLLRSTCPMSLAFKSQTHTHFMPPMKAPV
jgi:hypothetical protein